MVVVLSVRLLAVFWSDVALLNPLVLDSSCAFVFIVSRIVVTGKIWVDLIREIVWVHAAVLVSHIKTLIIISFLWRNWVVFLVLFLAWEINLINKILVLILNLILVVFWGFLLGLFFKGVFLNFLFLETELLFLLIDKVHELELQIEFWILLGASNSLGICLRIQGTHCDLKEIGELFQQLDFWLEIAWLREKFVSSGLLMTDDHRVDNEAMNKLLNKIVIQSIFCVELNDRNLAQKMLINFTVKIACVYCNDKFEWLLLNQNLDVWW